MSLLLIRHAASVSRDGWREADELRPLSKKGHRQARQLVPLFADVKVTSIRSSPSLRCVQTVTPMADARQLELVTDDRLAVGSTRQAVDLVRSMSAQHAALCTHGDVIPEVLADLADNDGIDLDPNPRSQKGSVWRLEPAPEPGRFRSAAYIPPAR